MDTPPGSVDFDWETVLTHLDGDHAGALEVFRHGVERTMRRLLTFQLGGTRSYSDRCRAVEGIGRRTLAMAWVMDGCLIQDPRLPVGRGKPPSLKAISEAYAIEPVMLYRIAAEARQELELGLAGDQWPAARRQKAHVPVESIG